MAQWCIGSFPDCSANYTTIQPDPDIDGIGVFSAFITTAGLSLIVMFAGTVIKHLPEKPEEKTGADNCQPSQSAAITSALQTNRTDPAEAITNVPRKGHTWIQVTEDTREYWLTIIEKLMLSISDQQLVTGITILATGFLKCDITAYHFSFVSDLAWLSSSAHMISLRFLDLYLRKYAAARIWRIFLMFCMYVLLMATLILENSSGWYGNLAFPAQCYFMDTTDSFITKGATALAFFFNTFLLTLGYARVLAPLILLSFAELRKWLLSKISSPVKSVMPPVVRLKTVGQDSTEHLSRSGTTLFSRARTWWNNDWVTCFFDSFWFGWGVYGMVSDRTSGAPYIPSGSLSAQSNWGFGQLVPVFLIFIPIFTAFEIFWEQTEEFITRKKSRAAQNAEAKAQLTDDATETELTTITEESSSAGASSISPLHQEDSESIRSLRREDTESMVGMQRSNCFRTSFSRITPSKNEAKTPDHCGISSALNQQLNTRGTGVTRS